MLSLVLVLALTRLGASTCFLPNGTASDSQGAQPCSFDPANPLSATCCNTKWENPPGGDLKFGQPKDECLPNGLCQNRGLSTIQGKEAPAWTHFYRVYCTNKDWSNCLSVCDTGLNADAVVQLTPCDGTNSSEKWCCGDTMDCCGKTNSARAVIIPKMLVLGSNSTSSVAPSSSTSAASAASSSASASSSSSAQQDTSFKKQRNIGLGVGLGIGLPVMLALGLLLGALFMKRRRGETSYAVAELHDDTVQADKTPTAHEAQVGYPRSELYAKRSNAESELGPGRMKVELP